MALDLTMSALEIPILRIALVSKSYVRGLHYDYDIKPRSDLLTELLAFCSKH